jgi:hypothetical protein
MGMTAMIGAMEVPAAVRRLLLSLLAVTVLGGCRLLEDTPGGSALVRVEARGGRCLEGECVSRIDIDRGGQVSGSRNGVAIGPVQFDARLLAPLVLAVDAADYVTLASKPFTGTCPTAFDGQELVYTFHPQGRDAVTLASCTVEIDPAHPLFRAVDAALAAIP